MPALQLCFTAFVVASSIPALASPPSASSTEARVKLIILAGQSNMAGPAVVDLVGEDYNDGRGTLVDLAKNPEMATLVAPVRNPDGSWRVRDDVFVRYTPEDEPPKVGPLTFGFTPQSGRHHFGPELMIGAVLGDAIDEPVLLVKTAWGGKSLYEDFRPPSSGGGSGPYYRRMVADVRSAIENAGKEIPALRGRTIEISGLIWYHGWNDGCDPVNAVRDYEANLVNLIRDLRDDLEVPDLPAVVGEITGPWVDAPDEWGRLREAQASAANRDDWKGRVTFVPTAAFVRDPDDSPHPTHAHHEFGNAETYLLVGKALGEAMRALIVPGAPPFVPTHPAPPRATVSAGEMSGYMLVPVERAPDEFNAGFSLYSAAWPLVETYPGSRYQTGLFGTWMFAQFSGDKPKELYSDIEGGLGWWRDTRFATTTPKFIMGGVALNFSAWANGPGAGKGRDWDQPLGKYAVAQLSPWVLWPPDGLNLAQGTCGELFGYGYVPLPLVEASSTTGGTPTPTGDQCWTLFLNTVNFKGPLCFFVPSFWSMSALERSDLAGCMLDSRGSDPNKAFQMETQWIPAMLSTVTGGNGEGRREVFARVAPMSFPIDAQGRTVVLHRLTTYTRAALTDAVRAWFSGGSAPSGALDPAASHVQTFGRGGGSTWSIFADGTPDDRRRDIDWASFGTPIAHDPFTFGYEWNAEVVHPVDDGGGRRVRVPEYFRLERRDDRAAQWVVTSPDEIPQATQLLEHVFESPHEEGEGAYVTPDDPKSPFRAPGPVAGPFEVTLGDGSTVTYAWYRFADQPAMLSAGLTDAQREESQRRIELLHRHWTKDRTYITPPTTGSLASLDPALIVTPPRGLEVGYVPIVLRQERRGVRR